MEGIAVVAAVTVGESERQTIKVCLGDTLLTLTHLYNMHEKKKFFEILNLKKTKSGRRKQKKCIAVFE